MHVRKSGLKSVAVAAVAFAAGVAATGATAFSQGAGEPCNAIPLTGVTHMAPVTPEFSTDVAALTVGCADGTVHYVTISRSGVVVADGRATSPRGQVC
jgi:hypothetical protein